MRISSRPIKINRLPGEHKNSGKFLGGIDKPSPLIQDDDCRLAVVGFQRA